MSLKSYLIDRSLLGMYMSPQHEVKTSKGYVTYRFIEGDDELELKKQTQKEVTKKRIYLGQMIHTTDDPTEQKFIESKPYYGKLINVYDPLALNKEKSEKVRRDAELLVKIANMDQQSEILIYGIRIFGNAALEQSAKGDIEGLRLQLVEYAQENPEKMIEIMNKDNHESAEYLFASLAFAKGIIKSANGGRNVVWANNETNIISVVVGQEPLDALVQFFKTIEGKEVKQMIGAEIETIVSEKLSNKKTEK